MELCKHRHVIQTCGKSQVLDINSAALAVFNLRQHSSCSSSCAIRFIASHISSFRGICQLSRLGFWGFTGQGPSLGGICPEDVGWSPLQVNWHMLVTLVCQCLESPVTAAVTKYRRRNKFLKAQCRQLLLREEEDTHTLKTADSSYYFRKKKTGMLLP